MTIVPPSVRADGGEYAWPTKTSSFGDAPMAPDWLLFLVGFSAGEQVKLAKLGINSPEDFGPGLSPAQWQATAAEKLRRMALPGGASMPLMHRLDAAVVAKVTDYVKAGIVGECKTVSEAEPGDQEKHLNNAGMSIHGLLDGAEYVGIDVSQLTEWALEKYTEACCAMVSERHREAWDESHALAKWEHTRAGDVQARDLRFVLPTNADEGLEVIGPPTAAGNTGTTPAPTTPATDSRAAATSSSFKVLDLPDNLEDLEDYRYLFQNEMERGTAAGLVGPGGTVKSALANALAVGAALDDAGFLGFEVAGGPQKCLIINNEDSAAELRRRIVATCIANSIDWKRLKGKIHYWGPDKSKRFIAVARENKEIKTTPEFAELQSYMLANGISFVVVDPLKSVHTLQENDNSDIDPVARAFADLAKITDACTLLVHHARKDTSGKNAGNADIARGASALKDACRRLYTLLWATSDDCKTYGFSPKDKPHRARLDPGKGNYVARGGGPKWYKVLPVELRKDLHSFGLQVLDAKRVVTPPKEGVGKEAFRAALKAAVEAGQGVKNPVMADGLAAPVEALREPFAVAYRRLMIEQAKKNKKDEKPPTDDATKRAFRHAVEDGKLPLGYLRGPVDEVDCIYERELTPAEHFATDPDEGLVPIDEPSITVENNND